MNRCRSLLHAEILHLFLWPWYSTLSTLNLTIRGTKKKMFTSLYFIHLFGILHCHGYLMAEKKIVLIESSICLLRIYIIILILAARAEYPNTTLLVCHDCTIHIIYLFTKQIHHSRYRCPPCFIDFLLRKYGKTAFAQYANNH